MNGGFVGSNYIPQMEQIPKFHGKELVRTYNFNLDIESTKAVLNTSKDKIDEVILVGKHLCHNKKILLKTYGILNFLKSYKRNISLIVVNVYMMF